MNNVILKLGIALMFVYKRLPVKGKFGGIIPMKQIMININCLIFRFICIYVWTKHDKNNVHDTRNPDIMKMSVCCFTIVLLYYKYIICCD